MSQTIELFSTPIYITQLHVDVDKLIKLAYQEKEKNPKGRILSNNGGYQTGDLNYKNYKFLFDDITPHIKEFVKKFDYKTGMALNNFWININKNKDYNNMHTHPNSVFSGVFYIKTSKECGDIIFKNPFTHLDFVIDPEQINEKNKYNRCLCSIKIESNFLLLFPSWLEHRVNTNFSDEERISLSFNLNPVS